jgi:hypothetical protein
VSNGLPLRLELSPCTGFAALLLLVHAVGAACLATVLSGWAGIALALLVLALGFAAAWDRALLRAARSPRAIEIRPSGEALCILATGEAAALEPLGGGAVTRYWVALGLRAPARRALLVPAGMMSAESARLLRLWARWGKVPGVAPRQRPA